ncbi:hypothetical protein V1505DRAFT_367091 [Lipomyces doorenjongii]
MFTVHAPPLQHLEEIPIMFLALISLLPTVLGLNYVAMINDATVNLVGVDHEIYCPKGIFGIPYMPKDDSIIIYDLNHYQGMSTPESHWLGFYDSLWNNDIASALWYADTLESRLALSVINGQYPESIIDRHMSNCSQVLFQNFVRKKNIDVVAVLAESSRNHRHQSSSSDIDIEMDTDADTEYTSPVDCYSINGAYQHDCKHIESWLAHEGYYTAHSYAMHARVAWQYKSCAIVSNHKTRSDTTYVYGREVLTKAIPIIDTCWSQPGSELLKSGVVREDNLYPKICVSSSNYINWC